MTKKPINSQNLRPEATLRRLTNDELDRCIYEASWGRNLAASVAIGEIIDRLIAGDRLTEKSVTALIEGLIAVATGKDSAKFLFPQLNPTTPRKGRPASVDKLTEWIETMMLVKVRKEGFRDLSPERAESSGKQSSFQEAAERMGLRGLKARQAAERMRKRMELSKKELGRRMPELFAVKPKSR